MIGVHLVRTIVLCCLVSLVIGILLVGIVIQLLRVHIVCTWSSGINPVHRCGGRARTQIAALVGLAILILAQLVIIIRGACHNYNAPIFIAKNTRQ
mgnify:CR=1 FL=1